jgi:transmembrane sensor
MSEIIRLRTPAEIEDEAAAWVWRLDAEHVSAEDRQAFEQWLRRDLRHRRAFEELGGVWQALDGLATAKREEKIATFAEVPASSRVHVFRTWRVSIAAALVLVAAGITTLMWSQRGNEMQTIGTAVGEQRAITLADGSVVHVNTNSRLETRLAAHGREVYLGKGEAHFSVAHDSQRPFRVHAGGAVVRAVGTEFDVRVHEDRSLEVIVTEGRVVVWPVDQGKEPSIAGRLGASGREPSIAGRVGASAREPSTAGRLGASGRELSISGRLGASGREPSRELTAGQRLVARNGELSVSPIDSARVSRVLAWRKGAVVFDGEPLTRALTELNRYTETRFVITDPAVGELRVGGRFRTDDIEGIVAGLEAALPVSARRTDGGLIFIEPRS